ncbi:MAG: xanthine dehydrogenase accessory protein XdhC [Vitreoscilla sp.]
MDRDTRLAALHWLEQRTPAVVVEIVDARGSAPRGAGTRMLVSAAQAIGTIGGGHLEYKALAAARAMLATREPVPRRERYPLGPSLGQCCGGVVELQYALLDDQALAHWPDSPPLLHLQMHGGGHVGRAIATLLATLDVRCDWIDERDDGFAPTTTLGTPWPDSVRIRVAEGAEAEVAAAPPGAFFLVLTHDHALDLRIVEAALRRDDAAFVGVIGSKTKRERFRHRLAQRGLSEERVARMQCPVGLPGISGKQPEIIALAVVAQLMQHAPARADALSPASPRLRTAA